MINVCPLALPTTAPTGTIKAVQDLDCLIEENVELTDAQRGLPDNVSGRWTMASGINHSTWVLGACRVFDGDTPRLTPSGTSETQVVFVPRSEVQVIDTWHVAGLRGAGSHDYQVHQVFVPAYRACTLVDEALQPGPLYRLPYISTATVLMACVALGIARHALDILEKLVATNVPSRTREPFARGRLRPCADR
jgi:alkylation response protein AidB-like acyl-CoA dehydrogenase